MWSRLFFYKRECLKTTWTFRLAVVGGAVLLIALTRGFWIPRVGRSLICNEQKGPADAILIDNLEASEGVFERAAAIRKTSGLRVFVPVQTPRDLAEPSIVSKGIAEVMARAARLEEWTLIPVHIVEPISLNAAYQIRRVLADEHVRSVIIVTPGFRSRRSSLIYGAILPQAGITPLCEPVVGEGSVETWMSSWHGIDQLLQQFIKLQYYRFWVLPFRA